MGMTADDETISAVIEQSLQRGVRLQCVVHVVGTDGSHVVVTQAVAQQQPAMRGPVLSRCLQRRQPATMLWA